MKHNKYFTILLTLSIMAITLSLAACVAVTPQVIEKEVVVIETVEVEKIVEVEKEAGDAAQGPVELQMVSAHPFVDENYELNKDKDPEETDWPAYYAMAQIARRQVEEKYPNYQVKYMDWGWAEELDQKIRASIAAGNAPDIVRGEPSMFDYANNDLLEPLPEDIVNMVHPTFLVVGRDGVPYAVANSGTIFSFFYNKDLLEAAGLDPESPPTTWAEWQEMSDAVTAAGNGEFYGGGVPMFPHLGGTLRCSPFLRQKGGGFGDGLTVTLDTPENLAAFEFIRAINKNFPEGLATNPDEGPMWDAFMNGKLAFAVDGAWRGKEAERTGMNYGVAVLPLPEGGVPANTLVGMDYYGVTRQSKNKEAAFNLIRILVSSDVSRALVEYDFRSPSNLQVFIAPETAAFSPVVSVMINQMSAGAITGLPAWAKNSGQVWDIIHQVLVAVTITDDPIEQLLEQAQSEAEQLLK